MEADMNNKAVAKNILSKIIVADFRGAETKGLDLTQSQIGILRHVMIAERNGAELSMTEVSQLLDITKSAASQAVSKLERKGILKRRWAKGDRRRIIVNMTAKGNVIMDMFHSDIIRFIEEKLEKLSDDEKKILMTIFEKCIN